MLNFLPKGIRGCLRQYIRVAPPHRGMTGCHLSSHMCSFTWIVSPYTFIIYVSTMHFTIPINREHLMCYSFYFGALQGYTGLACWDEIWLPPIMSATEYSMIFQLISQARSPSHDSRRNPGASQSQGRTRRHVPPVELDISTAEILCQQSSTPYNHSRNQGN